MWAHWGPVGVAGEKNENAGGRKIEGARRRKHDDLVKGEVRW